MDHIIFLSDDIYYIILYYNYRLNYRPESQVQFEFTGPGMVYKFR